MGLFRHPHLTRGVVHTSKGSFAIRRGIVDAPDDVGESYGWLRVVPEDERDGAMLIAADLTHTGALPLEF
jgi:hypothetical protein